MLVVSLLRAEETYCVKMLRITKCRNKTHQQAPRFRPSHAKKKKQVIDFLVGMKVQVIQLSFNTV